MPTPPSGRFTRSANLEADFGRVDALSGYIVSPLSVQTTTRICQELLAPNGSRAWFLVGPYGSGKSSFLTFLSAFLSGGTVHEAAHQLLQNQQPRASEAALECRKSLGTLVPVVLTGQRGALASALLRALHATGERLRKGKGRPPGVLTDLKQLVSRPEAVVDGRDVADLVVRFAQMVADHAHGAGVVLLVDELGKFLEYAALHPAESDVYLLQQLAEAASRAPAANLSILTVLHQDFEEYSLRLPASAQTEWSKVRGRFETIPFMESSAHLLQLMARAIQHQAGPRQRSLVSDRASEQEAKEVVRNMQAGDPRQEGWLKACAPMNAVTALCVGPLFRTRLAQNERSLFSFLNSKEPAGFLSHLDAHADAVTPPPYTLDLLYDYIIENTPARAGGAGRARVWAAAEEAMHRLPANSGLLESRVVKAVAVLTAIGDGLGLPTSKRVLALALSAPAMEVGAAVDRLSVASVLVFRRFRKSYQIWDGSDLDIDTLVLEGKDHVAKAGQLANQVQELLPPFPVIAAAHYHRTGTFRSLDARFACAAEASSPYRMDCSGDGLLLMLLPDSATDVDRVSEHLASIRGGPDTKPRVVALPTQPEQLIEAALEALAVRHVLLNTSALENDPIARRELDVRMQSAMDALTAQITVSFSPPHVRWMYRGAGVNLNGRTSAAASTIFDQVFHKSPRIHNELINREILSSAAAAARNQLLGLMITNVSEEALGLTGHPPELSLYRSVLQNTGLHAKREHGWSLGPPVDPTLAPLMEHIWTTLVQDQGKHVSFAELLQRIQAPPFGIRAGVGLVLLFAWFLWQQDEVFFYEDDRLVPVVGADIVQRLLRAPETCHIQMPVISRAASEVVQQLIMKWNIRHRDERGGGLFDVVRATIAVIRKLPKYALQTQTVSANARRVRAEILHAKDPTALLISKLPTALGMEPLDQPTADLPGEPERFVSALTEALEELQRCTNTLLAHIEKTLQELLRIDAAGSAFFDEIAARARALGNTPDLPPRVARWVGLAGTLGQDDPTSQRDWLMGIGNLVIGKLPDHWSDEEARQFSHGAVVLCREYLATEELSLERRRHSGASFQMVRVSVMDSAGNDRSAVATLRDEDVADARAIVAQLNERARGQGRSSRALAYAVVAELLGQLSLRDAGGAGEST